MKVILQVASLLFMAFGGSYAEEADLQEGDTLPLVEKLKSEDFEERHAATQKLQKAGDSIWPQLRKILQEERDPAVRAGIQSVIRGTYTARLTEWAKEAKEEVEQLEQMWKQHKQANEELLVALCTREVRLEEEYKSLNQKVDALLKTEPLPVAAVSRIENALRTLSMCKDVCIEDQTRLKKAYESSETVYVRRKSETQTRSDQLRFLLLNPAAETPVFEALPKLWHPTLLKFEERVKLPLTFEFVDVPLSETLVHLSTLSGNRIEMANEIKNLKDLPPISLRVSDMAFELALQWVLRLAELEHTLDPKQEAVLIHGVKPKVTP